MLELDSGKNDVTSTLENTNTETFLLLLSSLMSRKQAWSRIPGSYFATTTVLLPNANVPKNLHLFCNASSWKLAFSCSGERKSPKQSNKIPYCT